MLNNAIGVDKSLAQYAGPGGWNDIDALIGTATTTAVHLTPVLLLTVTTIQITSETVSLSLIPTFTLTLT